MLFCLFVSFNVVVTVCLFTCFEGAGFICLFFKPDLSDIGKTLTDRARQGA